MVLEQNEGKVAAYIAESLMSCAGIGFDTKLDSRAVVTVSNFNKLINRHTVDVP